MDPKLKKWLKSVGSLEMSVLALVLLMALTVVCTLDQVNIGTFNAADKYFRAMFLYREIPGLGWKVPVFPAGGFVGLMLLGSLISTLLARMQMTRKKLGIWLIHIGMIMLVLGEFVTGKFAVESNLSFEEGETKNYSEDSRKDELIVTDHSDPSYDEVISVSGRRLASGRVIRHERLPFTLHVKRWFPNAELGRRPEGLAVADSVADRGIGREAVLQPLEPVSRDDRRNLPAAFVELKDGERSLGTWLVSSSLGAQQTVLHGGKRYSLALRAMRYYMPFSLTLKDFTHDRYAGTDIPKNFSSLVRLRDPENAEDRDVLIYMNHPLRHQGRTFYQASFGKQDTMSILQTVVNPGWRLPYISCTIIGIGLLLQFLVQLIVFKPENPAEAPGGAQ